MPNYECAVILAPTLADEQIPQQIDQIKTWLAAVGAQVGDVDTWGRRKLAYPINKQQEGIYIIYYFAFEGGQSRLGEFDKRMNTNETVLRHMVIRLPKLKERPRLPSEEEEYEEGGGRPRMAAPPEAAPAAPVPEGGAAPEPAPAPEPAAQAVPAAPAAAAAPEPPPTPSE